MMTTLSPIREQFRSFEHVFLLKEKEKEYTLKIFDVSQKILLKKSFPKEQIDLSSVEKTSAIIPIFLENLIQNNLLPLEYSLKPKEMQDYKQTFSGIIQQFKPKVIVESKELDKFTCYLRGSIFKNPVIDPCGHTFEKEAIEEHLKKSLKCPMDQKKSITAQSLVPNLFLQQTIEEYQKQEPIVSFSLYKREKPNLAKLNLETARELVKEGEKQEALDCYAKAFKYTKKWPNYADIPALYESMQKKDKATLAYLYLTAYQLRDGQIEEAIQTLETCKKKELAPSLIDILLVQLLLELQQIQKAVDHILASKTLKENFAQAALLIQNILFRNPLLFDLYSSLADIATTQKEKSHIFLKGACHALIAQKYVEAEKLFDKALSHLPSSFLDQCIQLDLLKVQENSTLITRLEELASEYEKTKDDLLVLKVNKMLFQLTNKADRGEKIVQGYEKLQKKEKLVHWYKTLLFIYIESKEWKNAEGIALKALEHLNEAEHFPFYESLETVYSHWNDHKLGSIEIKLGQAYYKQGLFAKAEATYRKAYEKFHSFELSSELAKSLLAQKKIRESLIIYSEAANFSIQDKQLGPLDQCIAEIEKIDPSMKELDLQLRANLVTQRNILNLTNQLKNSEEAQKQLSQKLQGTEYELSKLKRNQGVKDFLVENPLKEECTGQSKEDIVLGSFSWDVSLGIKVSEPEMPVNLLEILNRKCPFMGHQGLRIHHTHELFLMPLISEGSLFLQSLQELPKLKKEKFSINNRTGIKDFMITEKTKSRWVLIARIDYDSISNFSGFAITQCEKYIKSCAERSSLQYEIAPFEYVLVNQLLSLRSKYKPSYSLYKDKQIISYFHDHDSLHLYPFSKHTITHKKTNLWVYAILKL
jgi:hypothetical protein